MDVDWTDKEVVVLLLFDVEGNHVVGGFKSVLVVNVIISVDAMPEDKR